MLSRRFAPPSLLDVASAAVLASAIASVVLFVFAARAYPGGTHFDHGSIGHDFWRNAICDVSRSTALGGAPNPGAPLARAAMAILALGIGAFFWLLPERFGARRGLGAAVRSLGAATVPGALAVVLLPPDRFGALHGVAIVIAGVPGLGAALLAVWGLGGARGARDAVLALALATLLFAASAFAIFVDELVRGGPPRLAVPILERVSAILLVAWMAAASLLRPTTSTTWRRPRRR